MLTYALFPQIGLKFIENRNNPDAFEPVPGIEPEPVGSPAAAPSKGGAESYTVTVNGTGYAVTVSEGGTVENIAPAAAPASAPVATGGVPVTAPLAGNIFKIVVGPGQAVNDGDVVMIMEAMKMETEIRTSSGGTVSSVDVKEGDAVQVGDLLLTLG